MPKTPIETALALVAKANELTAQAQRILTEARFKELEAKQEPNGQ